MSGPLALQLLIYGATNGAVVAVGLNVVVGLAGMLDLGDAAFFAIGGYTAALLTASGSRLSTVLPALAREPWLALPIAGPCAAGFGIAFGVPTVRARGEYLAVVTLAFGEIVPGALLHVQWTGGAIGMSGVPLPRLGPWEASSPMYGYVLALVLAGVACGAALRLAGHEQGAPGRLFGRMSSPPPRLASTLRL